MESLEGRWPVPMTDLEPFTNGETRTIRCIIEATRGTRSKFKYDPGQSLFQLHRVAPPGLAFPLDFGFIPGTLAEDGDPLDVLVFAEEPLPVGTIAEARLVGVIEADQTQEGETKRNDRLLAAAQHRGAQGPIRLLRDAAPGTIEAVEAFFVAYNALDGIEFKPKAVKGADAARRLIRRARERYERH